MHFAITSQAIDTTSARLSLAHEAAGAFASFEGWVRNHNESTPVTSLEYEAYTELAEAEGKQVIVEALEKFDLHTAAAVHRVGHLQVGEMAVWVGVTASHRGPAFEACRYIIDELKARVPIWKKEHYASGASGWINCATHGEFASDSPHPTS